MSKALEQVKKAYAETLEPKRYYIQIGVVTSEGYDEAESYDEILALALRYREEEQAKHGHLGKMWFDIEEVGQDDEV